MQLFYDIIDFLKSITFMDAMFFIATVILMLLIIILIYFIMENNEEDTPVEKKELSELESLKALTNTIENKEKKEPVINHYEEEQEEKAIISYDELINQKHNFTLNYSNEETISDDIKVKKVDLDNLVNTNIKSIPKTHGAFFTYEKEEAFLEALKALQQMLN